MAIKDMTGQSCGKLYIIERDLSKCGGAAYWICQCECGNIKSIRGQSLRDGSVTDCGCGTKQRRSRNIDTTSIIGNTYGKLTVLERDGSKPHGHGFESFWICQCSCGKTVSVRKTALLQGKTRSCGCLQQESRELFSQSYSQIKNITNNRYGKLVALERTENKDEKNGYIWKCQCDCGNIKFVPISLLTQGKVTSCGCIKTSKGEQKIEQLLTEANIPFLKEYIFSDFKTDRGGYYRYDFAIIGENNQVLRLIEFDGEQHFQEKKGGLFFKNQTLSQRRQMDQEKNNYAYYKKIPLVRIPYYDLQNFTLQDLLGDKYLIKI